MRSSLVSTFSTFLSGDGTITGGGSAGSTSSSSCSSSSSSSSTESDDDTMKFLPAFSIFIPRISGSIDVSFFPAFFISAARSIKLPKSLNSFLTWFEMPLDFEPQKMVPVLGSSSKTGPSCLVASPAPYLTSTLRSAQLKTGRLGAGAGVALEEAAVVAGFGSGGRGGSSSQLLKSTEGLPRHMDK